MPNIALKKPVEEQLFNASVVTDGNATEYTGNSGFAHFSWPGTLTIDLGKTSALRYIRFLLWDGLGKQGAKRNARTYRYRLLLSKDHESWDVLFDTGSNGYNGWQVFEFPKGVEAQFVRIHGLWNSANQHFHIVEVEAYDDDPPVLNAPTTLEKVILTDSIEREIGDALPLEASVQRVIDRIGEIVESHSDMLNPEPLRKLISRLRVEISDISNVERSMNSIKRSIIEPVNDELQKAARFSKFSYWGFLVGIIGGVLAIFSLILNIVSPLW